MHLAITRDIVLTFMSKVNYTQDIFVMVLFLLFFAICLCCKIEHFMKSTKICKLFITEIWTSLDRKFNNQRIIFFYPINNRQGIQPIIREYAMLLYNATLSGTYHCTPTKGENCLSCSSHRQPHPFNYTTQPR